MNVLLCPMPDAFEHTPALTMRMPNGALASLAGNVDPHHRVAIADLILAQHDVFVQPADINLQDEILMVISQVHQPVQADVLTADAGFFLQFTICSFFGSFAGFFLAADKIEPAFEGFFFSFAEEYLVLFPVKDHDAIHDFVW